MEQSGTELIAKERLEQIHKHGRTVERDIEENRFSQLIDGAIGILMTNRSDRDVPDFWSPELWQKMISKSYKERLIIAGALIAAEIDKVIAQGKTSRMTKKEEVSKPQLGMMVFHETIYDGKELMKVVGIREHEAELEGDYSGGTHSIIQKDWLPIKGMFRLRKV